MKENHRHREFSATLASRQDLFGPWEGDIFRSTSLDYPKPGDLLSGEGSYRYGGRWNVAGSCKAVYGSTSDTTAVLESRAHDAYYGITKFTKPRLLVAIHFRLGRVIDLTQGGIRRALGVTLREIREEDWRKLNEGGHESLTQALGRSIAGTAAAEALLTPSAAIKGGVNVVYISPRILRRPAPPACGTPKNSNDFPAKRTPQKNLHKCRHFNLRPRVPAPSLLEFEAMPTQSRKTKRLPPKAAGAGASGDLLLQAKRYGVSQTLVVRLTGYSPRAVAKWAGGEKPSEPARKSLAEMHRILEALGGIMAPADVGTWLREPNSAFDGSTPSQVIERGEADRIWRMIYRLESGEPG